MATLGLDVISQTGLSRYVMSLIAEGQKPKSDPGAPDSEPCPVRPDRPLNLSGGAAAALEFDE